MKLNCFVALNGVNVGCTRLKVCVCVCVGGGGVLVVIGLEYTPNERGHI